MDSALDYRGSRDQSSSNQKGQTRDSTQIKEEMKAKESLDRRLTLVNEELGLDQTGSAGCVI